MPRIQQLYRELERRHLHFRPHFWLSDEWYTPDGVPGVAIPFYLAHPRLAELECSQMLEVEGGTPEWCMRILRHESGHAIDNAYRLRRRRRRQQLFGLSSQPYPEHYTPRPYSRSYVLHLEPWYAQSHPDEDFAETFAVWLTPKSSWRKRYAGWPALKKLEYVDELMREIGRRSRPRRARAARRRSAPLLRKTLREHYREKRQRYGVDSLRRVRSAICARLFSDARRRSPAIPSAADVPARACAAAPSQGGELDRRVPVHHRPGARRHDRALPRARPAPDRSSAQTMVDFTIVLAVQTMHYLHSGRHRVWL